MAKSRTARENETEAPPVIKAITQSETGNDWSPDTLPVNTVISIASMNPQRDLDDPFGHLVRKNSPGRAVALSMAADGFLVAEGLPSVEPYSSVRHGTQYVSDLDRFEKFLLAQVAAATEASDVPTAEAYTKSLEWLLATYKPDAKNWLKPDYVVVGGNTRWGAMVIANGIRAVNGLPPIDVWPCMVFQKTLSVRDRLLEQALENKDDDTTTRVTGESRIRTMKMLFDDYAERGEEPPMSRQEYTDILSSSTGAKLNSERKAVRNMVDTTRGPVVLDHKFPQLNIYTRLMLKADTKDLKRLILNTAFGAGKLSATNELLNRVVPIDRSIQNNLRAKRGKEKGIEGGLIKHGTQEFNERLKAAYAAGSKTPFSIPEENEVLELIPPTEVEVANHIGGNAKAAPAAGKTLLNVQTGLANAAETDAGTAKVKAAVDAIIQDNDGAKMVTLAKTYGPTIGAADALDSPYTAAQWLEFIGKIDRSKHQALMNHVAKLSKSTPPALAGEQPEVASESEATEQAE